MAKAPKTPKVYTFKPIRRLTQWTLWLAGIEAGGLMAMCLGIVGLMMVGRENHILAGLLALVMLAGMALGFGVGLISGVVSLVWIYNATRNAHALRPGALSTSPAWAVGWFFVPIAGLFKPVQNVGDVWVASHGPVNGVYRKAPVTLLMWWLPFVIGNVVLRLADKVGEGGDMITATPSNLMFVIGFGLIAFSTMAFWQLVREIGRNQPATHMAAAEVF